MPPESGGRWGGSARKFGGSAMPGVVASAIRRQLDHLPGMTQRTLAARLGCDESHLSRMLAGERPVDAELLGAIVEVVGPWPAQVVLEPAGFTVVPRADVDGDTNLLLDALEVVHHIGHYHHGLVIAAGDGQLDACEAAELRDRLRAARDLINGKLELLDAVARRERGPVPVPGASAA